jgi:hypothetical protein
MVNANPLEPLDTTEEDVINNSGTSVAWPPATNLALRRNNSPILISKIPNDT